MRGAVAIDLTGMKFGRLTVSSRHGSARGGNPTWNCQCACSSEVVVRGRDLKSGNTRSCGCLMRETVRTMHATHRRSHTPLYYVWQEMKERCRNPRRRVFKYYGGRGIKVCDRWANSFEAFLADVGERPAAGMSIDRINNDGDYEPGNVKWSTQSEQVRNSRPRQRRKP